MSRRVVLALATSADGFIADTAGSVDWLNALPPEPELEAAFAAFMAGMGDLVMGRRTYDQVRGFGVWPYVGKRCWVLTSRPPDADAPADVTFVNAPAADTIARLKSEPDDAGIWVVGGAVVAASAHQAGLIDQYIITVAPVLLGAGLPMFSGAAGHAPHALELLGVRHFGSFVETRYAKRG